MYFLFRYILLFSYFYMNYPLSPVWNGIEICSTKSQWQNNIPFSVNFPYRGPTGHPTIALTIYCISLHSVHSRAQYSQNSNSSQTNSQLIYLKIINTIIVVGSTCLSSILERELGFGYYQDKLLLLTDFVEECFAMDLGRHSLFSSYIVCFFYLYFWYIFL